jgi:hypothetical protein
VVIACLAVYHLTFNSIAKSSMSDIVLGSVEALSSECLPYIAGSSSARGVCVSRLDGFGSSCVTPTNEMYYDCRGQIN